MSVPAPEVFPSGYEVTCVPRGSINSGHFSITVAERAPGSWAVLQRGSWCLGLDGEWDYEPNPSSRTDEWKATHRFDLDTALRLAKEHASTVTCNGTTVADALAAGWFEDAGRWS